MFSERMRQFRKEKNIPYGHLHYLTGIKVRALQDIENQRAWASPEQMELITSALAMSKDMCDQQLPDKVQPLAIPNLRGLTPQQQIAMASQYDQATWDKICDRNYSPGTVHYMNDHTAQTNGNFDPDRPYAVWMTYRVGWPDWYKANKP